MISIDNRKLEYRVEENQTAVWHPDFSDPLITVAPKKWESAFFNRSFATLEIDSSLLSASNWDALNPFFQKLLQQADRQEIALIELSLDSRGFGLIPTLEAAGFRLVDSKVNFLTMINRHQVIRFDPAVGRLALATPDDLPAMLELTKNCFVHNPSFFSRFKHPDYFSVRESERYYCAWITNHLDDPKSLMAVLHHSEAVQGYYFFRKEKDHEALPVYVGKLAAVSPEYLHQGIFQALQTFLFDRIPHDRFFVDNATQLTNFPVLKNHITAQRRLQSITFIFYRKSPRQG